MQREKRTSDELLAMITAELSDDPRCADLKLIMKKPTAAAPEWGIMPWIDDGQLHPCGKRAKEIARRLEAKYDMVG